MPGLSKAFGSIASARSAQPFTFNDTISLNKDTYILYDELIAAGWNGTDVFDATVTIDPGVHVYSTFAANGGVGGGESLMDRTSINPAFPAGSALTIINKGVIVGRGGGVKPMDCDFNIPGNGLDGDNALVIQASVSELSVSVDNGSGTIAGGGGGGASCLDSGTNESAFGGGGASFGVVDDRTFSCGTVYNSSDGGLTTGGSGASGGSLVAGDGGDMGQNGGAATGGTHQAASGSVGNAVFGDAKITWIALGTILGPRV